MLPQSGGYAQKTTLVGIRVSDDEDPQGLKLTQKVGFHHKS